MRKVFFLLLVLGFCTSVYAQDVAGPPDTVKSILCKKWEVSYVMMGSYKIDRLPGADNLIYEFDPKGTFTVSDGKDIQGKNGHWNYIPVKKMVKLTLNGRSNATIISLTGNELIMLVDSKESTPDDPMKMKVVYKVKK